VIVDEGQKAFTNTAQDILNSCAAFQLPSETITAVLMREEEMTAFQESLSNETNKLSGLPPAVDSEKLCSLGCTRWNSSVFQTQLSSFVGAADEKGDKLPNLLQQVQVSNALLLIQYSSLDLALDAIAKLGDQVKQVALVAPSSKKSAQYLEQWTSAPVVSIDGICGATSPGRFYLSSPFIVLLLSFTEWFL